MLSTDINITEITYSCQL